MKYLLVLVIIISTFGYAQSSVTMICTPHLQELVNHGIPREFIFQRGANYCVAISDNSAHIIQEGMHWLLEKVANAFVIVQEGLEDMTEGEFKRAFDYVVKTGEGNYLEFFMGKPTIKQAKKQEKRFDLKAASEQESWLDDFIRFWNLDDL